MSGGTVGAYIVGGAIAAASAAASVYSSNKQAKAQEAASKRAEQQAKEQAAQQRQQQRKQGGTVGRRRLDPRSEHECGSVRRLHAPHRCGWRRRSEPWCRRQVGVSHEG